ncbi:uncharacterized protein LOC111864399 [Cryptotermes secundus]|uniref:uncharacterized protein LOC111864399 n=1 Tax=Cryptotermes secundus TaxID=105785 RepID=UPI000CD7B4A6|nr:uncharacterized protein LOC111864399 [Cryptotermes secundus]
MQLSNKEKRRHTVLQQWLSKIISMTEVKTEYVVRNLQTEKERGPHILARLARLNILCLYETVQYGPPTVVCGDGVCDQWRLVCLDTRRMVAWTMKSIPLQPRAIHRMDHPL